VFDHHAVNAKVEGTFYLATYKAYLKSWLTTLTVQLDRNQNGIGKFKLFDVRV